MTSPPGRRLARLAGLLADTTRCALCLALLDGRAWTVRELAAYAGVAPSTASEHLNRLVDAGLLVEHRQGRHRYVQLAGAHVAALLEELARISGEDARSSGADSASVRRSSLRAVTAAGALARGRTCFDHVAGRLGVVLTDGLIAAGHLDDTAALALTPQGWIWFTQRLGVAEAELRSRRRPVTRACLDWTERRRHLAGLAGACLYRQLVERGWVVRVGSGRAARITAQGKAALAHELNIAAAAWEEDPDGRRAIPEE
ncbi:helix-turn-helix domain-containing protein [Lipingzhangella sp. LS1_29]|uniref:Helix-turn-helix domain-containing protein n=1 Tax=Lipingzhangella rawalii TaxID=2055835 RepID=A0ABU2H136_9ACTN|nr:helix-turn-helix domain-containing protein [Lipingzhangella rawalii]MDS1269006.1 helix-turn-helix domain-containing protein [Lipingzhangella rawalii]